MIKFSTNVLLFFALSSFVFAEAKNVSLSTDRPDFSEGTAIVPSIQLEMGYGFDEVSREHNVGEVLIRVPLTPDLEGRFGLNSLVLASSPEVQSFEDPSLGVKVKLRESQNNGFLDPDASLLLGMNLPIGGTGLKSDYVGVDAKLCLGWALDETYSFSSNLNYHSVYSENTKGAVSGTATLAVGLTDRVGCFVEYFGTKPLSSLDESHIIHTGITYLVSPIFQLDVRVGYSMTVTSGYFVGTGLSYRFD